MDRRMDGCMGCAVLSGRMYAMKRIDDCIETFVCIEYRRRRDRSEMLVAISCSAYKKERASVESPPSSSLRLFYLEKVSSKCRRVFSSIVRDSSRRFSCCCSCCWYCRC